MRRHGRQTWLRNGLAALAAVVICVILFSGWVCFAVFAIDQGVHTLVILASVPVVAYAALTIARGFDAALGPWEDDPFTRTVATTNWKLCDPMLSTFGLWRVEVERDLPDIDGFKNGRMAREFVRRLVRDWSIRSAWPCAVQRVSRANPRTANPFEASGGKVYRITLVDQWDGIRRGWIRFADGCAEFQVEAVRPQEFPTEVPVVVEDPKKLVTPELCNTSTEPDIEPLWDRWLDA